MAHRGVTAVGTHQVSAGSTRTCAVAHEGTGGGGVGDGGCRGQGGVGDGGALMACELPVRLLKRAFYHKVKGQSVGCAAVSKTDATPSCVCVDLLYGGGGGGHSEGGVNWD